MMEHVLRFRASHVTSKACDDENIAYVFLRSEEFPQGHYLMISRSLGSVKKSDVFVEYNDQAQVTVNGVSAYRLREDSLTLEIPPEAAEELGLPGVRQIVVDFNVSSVFLSELHRALTAIF